MSARRTARRPSLRVTSLFERGGRGVERVRGRGEGRRGGAGESAEAAESHEKKRTDALASAVPLEVFSGVRVWHPTHGSCPAARHQLRLGLRPNRVSRDWHAAPTGTMLRLADLAGDARRQRVNTSDREGHLAIQKMHGLVAAKVPPAESTRRQTKITPRAQRGDNVGFRRNEPRGGLAENLHLAPKKCCSNYCWRWRENQSGHPWGGESRPTYKIGTARRCDRRKKPSQQNYSLTAPASNPPRPLTRSAAWPRRRA